VGVRLLRENWEPNVEPLYTLGPPPSDLGGCKRGANLVCPNGYDPRTCEHFGQCGRPYLERYLRLSSLQCWYFPLLGQEIGLGNCPCRRQTVRFENFNDTDITGLYQDDSLRDLRNGLTVHHFSYTKILTEVLMWHPRSFGRHPLLYVNRSYS
jgi:hypothetical protein